MLQKLTSTSPARKRNAFHEGDISLSL